MDFLERKQGGVYVLSSPANSLTTTKRAQLSRVADFTAIDKENLLREMLITEVLKSNFDSNAKCTLSTTFADVVTL